MTRREGYLLTFLVVSVVLMLLAAGCGPTPTPQTITVVETVVVEKPAERVVETVEVVKTVEVEKVVEITATPEPKPEGIGEIKSGYTFEEGTLLLTPQPDLVAQVQLKPDYKASKDLHVVFITKHLLNPYFVAADLGAKQRCADMGVTCDFYAPEKPDNPEEQIRMIEDAVNKGVDGILLFAVDSKAVSPALQKANNAGIPVVGLGTVPFGAELVTFLSADYYGRSYEMAKILADALGGTGNVVTIDGVPGAQNSKDMKSGYLDALAEYKGINVLASQTGYWKRLEGMAAMENLLQRHPEVAGVVGSDDESALGAAQALEAAGYAQGEVKVVGFNATHDAVCAIKEGRLYASDNADPGGLAAAGMEFLVRHILDGEQFPPEVPWPLPDKRFYVTVDNIDEFWPIAWSLSEEERASGECVKK